MLRHRERSTLLTLPFVPFDCTDTNGVVKHEMKPKEDFREAISGLQRALGDTQEGMARRLGCTLGAYSKWVRGERSPQGKWLLKLLSLCPSQEERARFGLDIYPGTLPQYSGLRHQRKEEDMKRIRARENAHRGIEVLFERALRGSKRAEKTLLDVAQNLQRLASGPARRSNFRAHKLSRPEN